MEQSHVLRFSSAGKVKSAIDALDASIRDTDFAGSLHRELLFLEFMIQLNRAALHNNITFIANSSDEKITAILNYLSAHLTEDISIDDLSNRFFLSRYYLMHTFKEQTGYTIGSYISTKRLLLAQDLIAAGTPITEVCYSAVLKIIRLFHEHTKKGLWRIPKGISPKHLILRDRIH